LVGYRVSIDQGDASRKPTLRTATGARTRSWAHRRDRRELLQWLDAEALW
jgi:hypothetical protein